MIYFKSGSETTVLNSRDLESGIISALEKLGVRKKVLVVPPDCTRFHSRAGELTSYIYRYYKDSLKDILPALGTHYPMTDSQINEMFKKVIRNNLAIVCIMFFRLILWLLPIHWSFGVSVKFLKLSFYIYHL